MSFPSYANYRDSGELWLGHIPDHWDVRKLARSIEVIASGTTPSSAIPAYYEDGCIPWVNTGDLNDGDLFATARFITPSAIEDYSSLKMYPAGSIVIAMYGATIGKLSRLQLPATVNQACCVFSGKTEIAPHFLFYWLLGMRKRILSLATGGGQPNISQDTLRQIKIACPKIDEQQAIAAFLDRETAKIDALVAEQERLIELLKEKRQAVISHVVTKGLDPNVPMKDSGIEWLGEVPEHWEVVPLKHLIAHTSSITYGIVQAGPHVEDGVPYIKTSDMAGEALPLEGYSRTSLEIDHAYRRSKVKAGDIVVAIRATVGKCLPVPKELEGANLTQGTAKISPGAKIAGSYLLQWLSSSACQAYFDRMAKGATFREITLDALRRTPVAVPAVEEQLRIAEFLSSEVGSIDRLVEETQKAIALLKERHSALISAAVTGKIDVRGHITQNVSSQNLETA